MANKIDNIIDSIQSPQTTKRAIPQEVHDANVVIGYIAGNSWLTWNIYKTARPDLTAKGLVIPCSLTYAVPMGVRRCIYDIEPGGGKNGNIGLFAARCDRRSDPFYLYTFASNGATMLSAAHSFGFVQGRDFFYISAHANGTPHICEPDLCGYPKADITQYLFSAMFDKSIGWDYALPNYKSPVKHTDPYMIFPKDVGDRRLPNKGNERLTVEQADGALESWHKRRQYHDYLKTRVRSNIKSYRDRCWRIAKFKEPDFSKPRSTPLWNDKRHLGIRWQALNSRIKHIDAIK